MSATPKEREKMAIMAIEYHLPLNPAQAHIVAEKAGESYDYEAKRFVCDFIGKEIPDEAFDDFQSDFGLREIFAHVDNKPAFLDKLVSPLRSVSQAKLEFFLGEIPEIYQPGESWLLDLMVFKFKAAFTNGDLARWKIPYQDLGKYFNENWKFRDISEDTLGRIAWRIESLYQPQERPNFKPAVEKALRLYVLRQYKERVFDRSTGYLFANLSQEEKADLARIEIERMISEQSYAEAAKFAKTMGLRDLEVMAATLAYTRCMTNSQFKEASDLVANHQISDVQKAGMKEIERRERIPEYNGEESRLSTVKFAVEHGLTLRENQVYGTNHTPENLLKVNCRNLAQAQAKKELGERIFDIVLDEYFLPGNPYFSATETMAAVAQVLISKLDSASSTDLDKYFRDGKLLQSYDNQLFLEILFTEWLYAHPADKEEIQAFIARVLVGRAPTEFDFTQLAEKALQSAEFRSWPNYLEICEVWFADKYVEAIKIDNSID